MTGGNHAILYIFRTFELSCFHLSLSTHLLIPEIIKTDLSILSTRRNYAATAIHIIGFRDTQQSRRFSTFVLKNGALAIKVPIGFLLNPIGSFIFIIIFSDFILNRGSHTHMKCGFRTTFINVHEISTHMKYQRT